MEGATTISDLECLSTRAELALTTGLLAFAERRPARFSLMALILVERAIFDLI